MEVIYCCLKRENYKVFIFFFQIIPLALKEAPLLSTALQ